MKRAVELGAIDAAAIMTRGGKIRLRFLFTVEQLETLLLAAKAENAVAIETQCNAMKRDETHETLEQSRAEQSEEEDADARASPPQRPAPSKPDAARPAVFVIKGTRAWDAWVEYKKATTRRDFWSLTTKHEVDGIRRDGWWFPTLFPPPSGATGPP